MIHIWFILYSKQFYLNFLYTYIIWYICQIFHQCLPHFNPRACCSIKLTPAHLFTSQMMCCLRFPVGLKMIIVKMPTKLGSLEGFHVGTPYIERLLFVKFQLDVSENRGTPKSSMLIGFSIINHPFWGTPIFGNTHLFDLVLCSQPFSLPPSIWLQ